MILESIYRSASFSELFERVERKIDVDDSMEYKMVGVRLYGKGTFARETRIGIDILRKKQWLIRNGDIVYNKLFAWKGAFAVAEGVNGSIVSDKFPTYRHNEDLIDIRYLRCFFRAKHIAKQAKKLSRGSASISKLTLNPPDFYELEIPLPSKQVQLKIVSKLDYLFEKIDHIRKHSETAISLGKQLQNAVIVRAYRGEMRFIGPVISSEPLIARAISKREEEEKESRLKGKKVRKYSQEELQPVDGDSLWRIPSNWCWTRLSKIAKVERGRFSHRPRNDPRFHNGPYPFIQTGDISRSDGRIVKYKQTLNEEGKYVSRIFKAGSVLVSIAANIGNSAILTFDACVTDSVVVVMPFENVAIPEYIEFFMRLRKTDLEKKAPSTAQKNINLRVLRPLEIPLAPIEEQRQIVENLDKLTTRFKQVESKALAMITKADELEHSLFTSAFSGKLV